VVEPTKSKSVAFDLTDVSADELAKFRNVAIANVIRPITAGGDALASHDRHYSNHSKDKAKSFLITADDVVQPVELFKDFKGIKQIESSEYIKQLK